MPTSNRRTPRKVDLRMPMNPLPPLVGATAAGVVAYLVAESALAARLHPLHWLVAAGAAAFGLAAGYVIA